MRPALSWLDGRAGALVDEWAKSGVLQEVYGISGGAMFPGAPAACLKWLDLNEPQTLDRAATAGYCKDAIFGRLTGVRATDPSDASMPFGDGTGMGYSDRVLELTGLTRPALAAGADRGAGAGRRADTPRARPCSGCPPVPP